MRSDMRVSTAAGFLHSPPIERLLQHSGETVELAALFLLGQGPSSFGHPKSFSAVQMIVRRECLRRHVGDCSVQSYGVVACFDVRSLKDFRDKTLEVKTRDFSTSIPFSYQKHKLWSILYMYRKRHNITSQHINVTQLMFIFAITMNRNT